MPTATKKNDNYIEEMAGALTDPIIVYPGGWMDSVPKDLKNHITMERMVRLMKGDLDLATDAECCAYLMTRSLEAPLSYEWAQIYMYVFTKAMGDKAPEDVRVDSLDNYMMGKLIHFKRWIRTRQLQHRKERKKEEHHQQKAKEPQQQFLPLEFDQEVTTVA